MEKATLIKIKRSRGYQKHLEREGNIYFTFWLRPKRKPARVLKQCDMQTNNLVFDHIFLTSSDITQHFNFSRN